MKNKCFFITLIALCLFSTSINAQYFSLDELFKIQKMTTIEAQNYMLETGWTFNGSKDQTTDKYGELKWAYQKDENGNAKGWFSLYFFNNLPNKISYQSANKRVYESIKSNTIFHFKKSPDSKVENNCFKTTYESNSSILSISIISSENGPSTNYVFDLIGKYEDNPSNKAIIKAIENFKDSLSSSFDQNDYILEEESKSFIHGNFSGIQRKECIASFSMKSQTTDMGPMAYLNYVILFYKNNSGEWTNGNFIEEAQYVDTVNLDNDQIPEIICNIDITWMGQESNSTSIYSIKGDIQKKLLYSNNSNSDLDYLSRENIKVGDEVSRKFEISYVDTNYDGIKEIEEVLTIGYVKSIPNDNMVHDPDLYYKKTKQILKLVNGKYNDKPVFGF